MISVDKAAGTCPPYRRSADKILWTSWTCGPFEFEFEFQFEFEFES